MRNILLRWVISKVKNYEAKAAAKKVILFVQQKEGESKGNKVINFGDINDAAEMHGADSL